MSEKQAQEFDLDSWISGVKAAERSVTVYQIPDVQARVDQLTRELRIAEKLPDKSRGIADRTPTAIIEDIKKLEQDFESSSITVTVKGLAQDRIDKITKRFKKNKKDATSEEINIAIMLEAIVAPKFKNIEQLTKFMDVIGPAQSNSVVKAFNDATWKEPEVSVPFSLAYSDDDED